MSSGETNLSSVTPGLRAMPIAQRAVSRGQELVNARRIGEDSLTSRVEALHVGDLSVLALFLVRERSAPGGVGLKAN
jgi:hypothetical protein